jgi:hypothetical protein
MEKGKKSKRREKTRERNGKDDDVNELHEIADSTDQLEADGDGTAGLEEL